MRNIENIERMTSLRKAILKEANLVMIEDLSIKKIYNITGVLLKNDDSFFQYNFNTVVLAVIENEEKERTILPISKINGIIIKEVVNHIVRLINEANPEDETPNEMSTRLDDDGNDFFENMKIDEIEKLTEMGHQVEDKVNQDKKEEMLPVFEDNLYSFETEDMSKTEKGYISSINLKDVKEIQMVGFSLDNSDYVVTEYSNTFAVDNIEIVLECGNYNARDIGQEIQKQIDDKIGGNLKFKLKDATDTFYFHDATEKTRSMTSSLKEQKSYNIDFGTANSMNKLLGFEAKSYKLKPTDTIEGVKHKLCNNQFVNIMINCGHHELKYKILMDVGYNNTKYFTPEVNKTITNMDGSLFEIDGISVSISDMYGNIYNTRGRNFNMSFRVKQFKRKL